jgi:hypothetical protein
MSSERPSHTFDLHEDGAALVPYGGSPDALSFSEARKIAEEKDALVYPVSIAEDPDFVGSPKDARRPEIWDDCQTEPGVARWAVATLSSVEADALAHARIAVFREEDAQEDYFRARLERWSEASATRWAEAVAAGIRETKRKAYEQAGEPVEHPGALFYDPTERRRDSYEAPAIFGLFYLGARTVVFGEAESGKTWLLLAAVVEEIRAGHVVLWLDTDDMGDGPLCDRLEALGLSEDEVAAGLLYANPEGAVTEDHVAEMVGLVRERGVRLVVCDSSTPAMLLEGKDPNVTTDVEAFWRKYANPVADKGAAFVVLSHVTKARETRGGSPFGSERWRTGATAMLELVTVEPFSRERDGRAKIVVQKDRPGYLAPRGHTVGELVLRSDGERVALAVVEPTDRTADGKWKPTGLMERVSRYLEEMPDAVTLRAILHGVEGKSTQLREAIDRLVEGGYVQRTPGANRAHWHTSAKPYRAYNDESDPFADTPEMPEAGDGGEDW